MPSDLIALNVVDPVLGHDEIRWGQGGPPFPNARELFEQHMHEHPVLAAVQRPGTTEALKISDFLSQRQLHDLGLYQEFYSRASVENQISFTFPWLRRLAGVKVRFTLIGH